MTLAQTAVITRNIITFSVFFCLVAIIAFVGYRTWYSYYLANLPPVEEVPDTKFGLLPVPDFPKTDTSPANFTYSIDTVTGNLPKIGTDEGFDKIIKVYFIKQVFATFLSAEKSQSLAEKFGITTEPEILSQTDYLYSQDDRALNINLDNGNFIYTKEATKSGQQAEGAEKLVSDFKNTLATLGALNEDLRSGESKVVTVGIETETFQISLWPKPIDKKPIVTSSFNKSLVNAVVLNNASSLNNYLSLNYTFWPVDLTTYATYPVKAADTALADLKAGKGVVIVSPQAAQASITSIYLAYFLPDNYNAYLVPVYVFKGTDFVAYVSAISEQFQAKAK